VGGGRPGAGLSDPGRVSGAGYPWGVRVLCLSPTPLAAIRATRRMCDAQGGIHFGPGATTLRRLASEVLVASGDRRAVLTPLAERLIVLEAGEAAGGMLSGLAPSSGLAGALSRTIAELALGEVEGSDLKGAAASLGGAPQRRLGLLADALEAYQARLAALGVLDGAAAFRAAAEAVRRGAWHETASLELLILDGLGPLGRTELDLVASLVSRAPRTKACLPYFPDRPDLSSPAEPLLRRLESLHEVARVREVEIVLQRLDDRAERVGALLSAFGRGQADRLPGERGLVLAAPGAGAAGEAEAAADAALRFFESGMSPDEVVVVAQSPRRVAPALGDAFRARGIPFSAGRGPRASEVPVVRLVREALSASGLIDRTRAVRLLGSSWLTPAGVADLSGLFERAGALDGRGAASGALRRRAARLDGRDTAGERRRLARTLSRLEELETSLAPLARSGPARAFASNLSVLLGRLGLRRRAARGPFEVAARDVAALSAVEDAAQEVVVAAALAGRADAVMSPATFEGLLGLALDASALNLPGEPAAGAVELLAPQEVAGGPARAAIVVGCGEGAFPAPAPPDPLFRDAERAAVDRYLSRAAVSSAGARRAEAVHRAFLSAAAGTEAVAFAWAAPGPAGDGGPPSLLVAEALAAAGVDVASLAPREPALSEARTVRSALRAAVRLGASGVAALRGTPLAAAARDALLRGRVDAERRAAVLSGRAGPFAGGVGEGVLPALWAALPAEWTPSQLELYARCPFRAFLRLALRLPEPGEPDLDMELRDEGTLLHAVLEQFVSARLARGAWPPSGGPEDLLEARDVAAEVLRRFEREGRTGDPAAFAGRREAVLHRLDRIVRAEARDHGGLTPRFLEYAFGEGGRAPALELSFGGEVVRLRGRIDRVDAGGGRLLVIDYKNSRGSEEQAEALDPESFGLKSFQVPAYLMAASRELPGLTLEATIVLLRRPARLEPVVLDPSHPRLRPAGEAGSFAAAVVERVNGMRAGRFPVAPEGCERCPYGAVCRFEGLSASRARGRP